MLEDEILNWDVYLSHKWQRSSNYGNFTCRNCNTHIHLDQDIFAVTHNSKHAYRTYTFKSLDEFIIYDKNIQTILLSCEEVQIKKILE